MSGVLAERSYSYLELGKPEMTLAMKDEIMRRSSILQSDHTLRRVYEYLEDMENAGYAEVQVVKDFREELKDTGSYSSSGETPHEI